MSEDDAGKHISDKPEPEDLHEAEEKSEHAASAARRAYERAMGTMKDQILSTTGEGRDDEFEDEVQGAPDRKATRGAWPPWRDSEESRGAE